MLRVLGVVQVIMTDLFLAVVQLAQPAVQRQKVFATEPGSRFGPRLTGLLVISFRCAVSDYLTRRPVRIRRHDIAWLQVCSCLAATVSVILGGLILQLGLHCMPLMRALGIETFL